MWIALAVLGALAMGTLARAQYRSQTDQKDKEVPALRAVAVVEWTGDLTKAKTSRLVPVTVYDGEQLQDGGVYLARPEPVAVYGGTEYILQKDGARIGLFDVKSAGQELGSWIGLGTWKAMPAAKPKAPDFAQKVDDDERSDRPVLHRKMGSSGDSGGSGSGAKGPPPDPDRPTLHKSSTSESAGSGNGDSGNAGNGQGQNGQGQGGQGQGPTTGSAPTPDTSKPSGKESGSSPSASDPDRPALKRGKAQQEDEGFVESLPNAIDPNRPRLMRGKSTGGVTADATPTLVGMPAGMEQAVAVSDPRNKPEHPWDYSWADPADELKMKAQLEDAARKALGLEPTTPPPAPKRNVTTKGRVRMTEAPQPAPLVDEVFRVFELAYGSGATMVLTAHTDGPPAQQKFVTLIAQPDLYGSLLVFFKSVTDEAHLDDKPRMRLVDAVDALADNRGELLFELRGKTQRQFALYRVLRGTATELFVTGSGATSIAAESN
ncbi:MAG: hypothetical protein WCC26_08675 [Terracidiphilus sp.]